MPRLDDPDLKLKQKKPFTRKSLRPWDNPDNFIPSKILDITNENDALNINKTEASYIHHTEEQPIGNQLVNNRETIGNQLVNNRETIGNQLVNDKVNNRETIGNQLVNDKVNNRKTIGNQISKKTISIKPEIQNTGYVKIFSTVCGLFGLQKTALFHIVENCKSRGLLYTTPITNEFFRTVLNTDINSVKTTIQRLIKKDLVCRKEAKKGKGGYTIFSITAAVRNATIEATKQLDIDSQQSWLLVGNRETIGNQLVNNKVNNKVNSAPVVSSKFINTTTNVELDIPANWQSINLEPLEQIGFNLSHLVQIHREYTKNPDVHHLSPELIQSSIDALAYDLKYNKDKLTFKKPPAVVFLSMLKKDNPYSSVTPGEYLSPQEEAMRAYNQAESIRKARELELMQQIKDTELKYWQEQLPEDELLAFCSEQEIEQGIPSKVRIAMRRKKAIELSEHYFNTEIWPNKAKEICAYSLTAKAQNESANNEQDQKVVQIEGT